MLLSKKDIKQLAEYMGFDLVGFSDPQLLTTEVSKLKNWIDKGYHAGMEYMSRNINKREDVKLVFEDTQSIISLGLNYYQEDDYSISDNYGKVSKYAWGKDYHFIVWEKLEQLIERITEQDPGFKAKSYIDTGPVMDKIWAIKSGLGWMGKHSNIISREIGSWFFIATIFTNRKFEHDIMLADHCGTCTACIDACPTNAIVDDYVVDANKCISYLTIENKEDTIDSSLSENFYNWLFGCDICQDVCPWNNKLQIKTKELEIISSSKNKELKLNEIKNMTNSEFKLEFQNSPILRAKINGMKRNADALLKD